MADFKTALTALGRGEIKFELVADNIERLLIRRPQAALDLMQLLREAFSGGTINATLYEDLKRCVADCATEYTSIDPTSLIADEPTSLATVRAGEHTQFNRIDEPAALDSQPSDSSSWESRPLPFVEDLKLEPGTVLKERFILDDVLGSGGMGTVYKGRDLIKVEARDKNPFLALKVLNEDFKKHPDAFIALQREASRQQRLAHPNIATVYDFDRTSGGTVFLTMELLEGQPLNVFIKNVVKPRNGLPFHEAFPMIQGLGSALVYAHERNIVHSDFKPGNCFQTQDGTMKVLDFGIARAVMNPGQGDGEKTLFDPGKLGALTPAYASAEMLEQKEPDPRDDIYALACVAYELLTGRHPFNKLPANSARDNKLIPPAIKGLTRKQMRGLARGLAFDRKNRSQSVAEFLREFEGKTPPYKNPLIAIPVAAGLLALVGFAPVRDYLHQRDLDARAAEVSSGDNARVDAALLALGELQNPEDRSRVLMAVRDDLLAHFEGRLRAHVDLDRAQYDFAGARQLLDRLSQIDVYKDSAQVEALAARLDEQENNLLATQTERFNALIERGALTADPAQDDALDSLAVMQQVAPGVVAPMRQRLISALSRAIDQALLAQDLPRAELLLKTARELVPDSTNLQNQADRIETSRDRLALDEKVKQLTGSVTATLNTLRELADATALRDVIPQLAALDPNHPLLETTRGAVLPLITRELEALQDLARLRPSPLLANDYSPMLRALGAAELARQNDALIARLDQRLAAQALSILQHVDTDPTTQDPLTDEFIALATGRAWGRIARDAQAYRLLREADVGETENGSALATAAALATSEWLQPLLVKRRDKTRAPTATLDTLRAATSQTDLTEATETAVIDVYDDALRNGAQRKEAATLLAEFYARRIAALRNQSEWDRALAVSERSLALLPVQQSSIDSYAALTAAEQQATRTDLAARQAELRADLESLAANPVADRAWRDRVQKSMYELTVTFGEDAASLGELATRLGTLLVGQAREMRLAQRFAESENILARAARLAPALPELATERGELTRAAEEFANAQREEERIARLDALKATFRSQARANDVAGASASFNTLRSELGADDPFARGQGPEQLARAYYRSALARAGAKDFASALRYARDGLKLKPNDQELRLAVNEYTVNGNRQILARSLREPAFDVREALTQIAEIQTLDPRAYGADEARWAQALANRLRALQTAEGPISNPLLEQAQSVFAGNDLLAGIKPVPLPETAYSEAPAIESAIRSGQLTAARAQLAKAIADAPRHADVQRLKQLYNEQLGRAKGLYENYQTAYRKRDFVNAKSIIDEALAVWRDSETFQKEQNRVVAALEAKTAVDATPRDGPIPPSRAPCSAELAGHGARRQGVCFDMMSAQARGPLLVVVPGGEGVAAPFAIGKYELTVSDFNAYCRLSGDCTPLADREGVLPLTNVSIAQIEAYATWLSDRSGHTYRLPTGQEWEHAARAGGKQPQKDYNCRVEQNGQVLKGQTVMGVNTGKANGWGLYNYVGNAQELVRDAALQARGGAFEDAFGKCTIELAKPTDGAGDPATGFRLVREIR